MRLSKKKATQSRVAKVKPPKDVPDAEEGFFAVYAHTLARPVDAVLSDCVRVMTPFFIK
jgi:hypothetical protein